MSRASQDHSEAINSDSFLDIVANIVGILIILVLVAGMRIRQATTQAAQVEQVVEPAPPRDDGALVGALTRKRAAELNVFQLANQQRRVQAELAARQREQVHLATALERGRQQLGKRRGTLDVAAQEQFDLRRQVSSLQQALDRLGQIRQAIDSEAPEAVKIESLPTPLSKTVLGTEMHFRLEAGRVVYVPLDRIVDKVKAELQQKAHHLRAQKSYTDTAGPVDGFYIRYTFERVDMKVNAANGGQVTFGSMATVTGFHAIPAREGLGETLDEALRPDSDFRRRIATGNPTHTTITLWVYPDAFDDFRRLKRELYTQGYPVAGRPMPQGIHIGGSPNGTKSAAQ